jgi:hypothetical protein
MAAFGELEWPVRVDKRRSPSHTDRSFVRVLDTAELARRT